MPVKIQVRLKGVSNLVRKLKDYPAQATKAAAGALYVEGEQSMTEMRPLVPVDEGPLRSSGHVQLPEIQGLRASVKLGFGGPAGAGPGATNSEAVGYATYVHEQTGIFGLTPGGGSRTQSKRRFRRVKRSKKYPKGRRARKFVGQSKYMSTVMDRRKPGMGARLSKRMASRLRRSR